MQWLQPCAVDRKEALMKSRKLAATVAIAALSTAAVLGTAFAQSGQPGLYAFSTGPTTSGCPGLDWHITLQPDNSLVGFVSWGRGEHIARLAGTLNPNRQFQMNAQEVGGQGRTAVVKGQAMGQYINVVISGSGSPCDNINLNVPRVAGGLGGGGG
jgi:hypothetical protein